GEALNEGLSPDFFSLSDPIGGVGDATSITFVPPANPTLGYGPGDDVSCFSAARPPSANYPAIPPYPRDPVTGEEIPVRRHLLNLSVRKVLGGNDDTLIVGFVVDSNRPRELLI